MKPIKMFGLVALAALLAMAFAGASSAMAESTELCYGDPGTGATATCPFGEPVKEVHEVSVGKAKLLASPRVECNVLFSGTVGAAGAPQVIEGHFTYTNCGCTVRERAGTTATIEVLRTGHEQANVTGEALIEVNCFGIVCTYKGEGLEGTAKGPLLSTEANGEVNLSEQEVRGSGSFCPASGRLDIKTTPLEPTYIGKGGALGYCVDTEHRNGIYTNNTCTTLGSPAGHSYLYTLIVGPAGASVNEIKCYKVLLPAYGLWEINNNGVCEKDDLNNRSPYEKGTIVTIH